MTPAGSRLRQLGWAVVLSICLVVFLALTFHVNSVKSEVRLAEREIIRLERKKLVLETEFEARASQQQLADWNRLEFGYEAPAAGNYLEHERELANLGEPRGPGAPEPIRVAQNTERAAPSGAENASEDESARGSERSPLGAMPRSTTLAERLSADRPLAIPSAELSQ